MPAPAIVAMNVPQVTELEARTNYNRGAQRDIKPLYLTQLAKVYQANNLALIWQDEK